MKILLVSYYVEAHLPSSAAQNTRLLARSLAAEGHQVSVVCASESAGTERVGGFPEEGQTGGYLLHRLPVISLEGEPRWLGAWRGDARVVLGVVESATDLPASRINAAAASA